MLRHHQHQCRGDCLCAQYKEAFVVALPPYVQMRYSISSLAVLSTTNTHNSVYKQQQYVTSLRWACAHPRSKAGNREQIEHRHILTTSKGSTQARSKIAGNNRKQSAHTRATDGEQQTAPHTPKSNPTSMGMPSGWTGHDVWPRRKVKGLSGCASISFFFLNPAASLCIV